MCDPEDPLFMPLLPLARVPFQAKESVHKTPFGENLEIFASTASIFHPNFSSQAPKFGNFQLTSCQIWKFSPYKPPHTPTWKKVECPPRYTVSHIHSKIIYQEITVNWFNSTPYEQIWTDITIPLQKFWQMKRLTLVNILCNQNYNTNAGHKATHDEDLID